MARFERNKSRGNGGSSTGSTTRLAQFYPFLGENKKDIPNDCRSTLSLSIWKKYLIFSIAEELPENEMTDNNVYDYDNAVQVMLSPIQVIGLKNAINLIRKSVKDKDDKYSSVAFACKDDLVLKFSSGKEYKNKNWTLAIVDSSDNNKGERIEYVFNWAAPENKMAMNYNDSTGGAEDIKVNKNMELEWFITVLDCALEGMTGAHSNGAISFINNALNKIMSSLDVIKGMMESSFANRGRGRSSESEERSSNRPGSGSRFNRGGSSIPSSSGSSRMGRRSTSKPSLDQDDDDATDVEDSSYDDIKNILSGDDDDEE